MIGIDILGLPTTFLFTPLAGVLGQLLLKVTIGVGIVVVVSHVITRLLKSLL